VLELAHSQDQKGWKISLVVVGAGAEAGDIHVADIQVADM
jgi:hypothetical protein